MSRILVTGGCGFVGQPTVAALLAAGHEVRVFDLKPREDALPGEVEIVAGDVTDGADVARAAEGCGGIVHLAGDGQQELAQQEDAEGVAEEVGNG